MSSPLQELCPEKCLTNHTARKTLIKELQHQGVPRSDIITVSSPAPLSTTNKSLSLSMNGQSAITLQSQNRSINLFKPLARP